MQELYSDMGRFREIADGLRGCNMKKKSRRSTYSHGKVDVFTIKSDSTVISAMRAINEANRKTIFIVDEKLRLEAVCTDGDVRRWILKGGDLGAPVMNAANKNPMYVHQQNINDGVEKILHEGISAVPVVDDDDKVIDILIEAYDKKITSTISTPVVMMAGGQGTRLYPYTKILPKPLIPIGDLPISELIINRFYEYGCRDFYFILNYKRNMIKAYFDDINRDYQVHYVDEKEPLGTGGGVGLLKGQINDTFILTNCDTLIEEDYSQFVKMHKEKKNLITMICSMKNYEVPYGVIKVGEDGNIESMQEKPKMPFLTNTGTYIVEPEVFDYIEENQRVDFPDVIMKIKADGKNVGIFPIEENAWLDMGQMETMEDMKNKLNIL